MTTYRVYIISNPSRTVLYIGVTNNIERRMDEYKQKMGSIFTSKYNVTELLYIEEYDSNLDAIQREKQLKGRTRKKKLAIIKKENPNLHEIPIF